MAAGESSGGREREGVGAGEALYGDRGGSVEVLVDSKKYSELLLGFSSEAGALTLLGESSPSPLTSVSASAKYASLADRVSAM